MRGRADVARSRRRVRGAAVAKVGRSREEAMRHCEYQWRDPPPGAAFVLAVTMLAHRPTIVDWGLKPETREVSKEPHGLSAPRRSRHHSKAGAPPQHPNLSLAERASPDLSSPRRWDSSESSGPRRDGVSCPSSSLPVGVGVYATTSSSSTTSTMIEVGGSLGRKKTGAPQKSTSVPLHGAPAVGE